MKYLLLLLILSSCYNSRKATEQVNKADARYPEVVAKIARDKYPCTDLLKNDTSFIYQDSLVFIDCPDGAGTTTVITDTISNTITKTIRVPVNVPVRTQLIKQWFEDSAKLKLNEIQINECIKDSKLLQAKNDVLQGKLDKRTKYLWWLLALCIGLGVLHIIRR